MKQKEFSLEQMILDYAEKQGKSHEDAFRDFLEYILECWNITWLDHKTALTEQLNAKKEANPAFFVGMLHCYTQVCDAMDKGTWVDVFGTMYEHLFLTGAKASRTGQFFTPKSVCDMMAQVSLSKVEKPEGKLLTVGEPSCGSGRNVLAFEMERDRSERAFYVCEDMDWTCCLMTAANMMMHGMFGVVWCHDVLTQDKFKGGYVINECNYPVRVVNMNSSRHIDDEPRLKQIIAQYAR